jgi:hypothetical protein
MAMDHTATTLFELIVRELPEGTALQFAIIDDLLVKLEELRHSLLAR